jgi:hypothetical protein
VVLQWYLPGEGVRIKSITMKTSVTKRLPSGEPWSIPLAAVVGFLTGVFVATVRHLSHEHAGYTSDALVERFVPHLITTATVCALVFALSATTLNRLIRKR